MIQNVINKQFLDSNTSLNIVYVYGENQEFKNFLQTIFSTANFIDIDKTFYGINNPHIIINNNTGTEEAINKSIELSKYFHIPLIFIFDALINKDGLVPQTNFEPCEKICLQLTSNDILKNQYDKLMTFDIYDKKNIEEWRSYILDLCIQPYLIKDENNDYRNNNDQ